ANPRNQQSKNHAETVKICSKINPIGRNPFHRLVNVLPLAIAGIYLAKAINKRIGTVSTYHPICIRDVFLVRKGMSIAAKKGMIIAKLMVNKLKPPMFSVHAL